MVYDKAAILTIDKYEDQKDTRIIKATVDFDWRGYDLDIKKYKDASWSNNDDIQHAQVCDHRFNKNDFYNIQTYLTKPIHTSNQLKSIGENIFDLFPKEIKESLRAFDHFADECEKQSTSPLLLIIHTDILEIPWELSITPRAIINSENQKNWFLKYMVGTKIMGPSQPRDIDTNEKKKIALVVKPFGTLDDKIFDKEFNSTEFKREMNNLKNTIKELTTSEKIEIKLIEWPFKDGSSRNLKNLIRAGNYDLILWLGFFDTINKSLIYQDPNTNNLCALDINEIEIDGHKEKILFLDACCTGICHNKIKGKKVKRYEFDSITPESFIEKGSPAYIGTIQKVNPTVALVFANNFLEAVFYNGFSLAMAMYMSRNKTYSYFDVLKDDFNKSLTCSFSLYSRNKPILFNSYRYRRDELVMIYPLIIKDYFSGFNKTIFPTSLPGIKLEKKNSFNDVINEIKTTENPFIADVSILDASRLINEFRNDPDKQLVIIGSLFRLNPEYEDAVLYNFKENNVDDILYTNDPLSTVTVMAKTYFKNINNDTYNRFSQNKINKGSIGYDRIFNTFKKEIEEGNWNTEPFVLASGCRKRFDEFLNNQKKNNLLNPINLYKNFLEIIKNDENYSDYKLIKNLPAEVLITRKKDIENDKKLFTEIYSRWSRWLVENKSSLPKTQDLVCNFDNDDVATIINYVSFVVDNLDGMDGEIKRSLKEDDFRLVEKWSNTLDKNLTPIRNECYSLIDYIKKNNLSRLKKEYDEIKLKIEGLEAKDIEIIPEEKIDIDVKKLLYEELEYKIKDFEKKINDSQSRNELNTIKKELLVIRGQNE